MTTPTPTTPTPATDKSQGIKADSVPAQAAVAQAQGTGPAKTPEPAPVAAGPKADDVPSSRLVQDTGGPAIGRELPQGLRREFTLNQPELLSILGSHFGFNPNKGTVELKWNETNSGLTVVHTG